jgi:hypothetical protein
MCEAATIAAVDVAVASGGHRGGARDDDVVIAHEWRITVRDDSAIKEEFIVLDKTLDVSHVSSI